MIQKKLSFFKDDERDETTKNSIVNLGLNECIITQKKTLNPADKRLEKVWPRNVTGPSMTSVALQCE